MEFFYVSKINFPSGPFSRLGFIIHAMNDKINKSIIAETDSSKNLVIHRQSPIFFILHQKFFWFHTTSMATVDVLKHPVTIWSQFLPILTNFSRGVTSLAVLTQSLTLTNKEKSRNAKGPAQIRHTLPELSITYTKKKLENFGIFQVN